MAIQSIYGNGRLDPITYNAVQGLTRALIRNARSRNFAGETPREKRRDIDDECHYPKVITAQDYKVLYEREPVATRVVEIAPDESWNRSPIIQETDDTEVETEFEKAWEELDKSLRGEESWHEDTEAQPILWDYLHRVDIRSGIYRYGALLVGLDDGLPLHTPATPGKNRLTYLRAFAEYDAEIQSTVSNIEDIRYGRPEYYNLNLEGKATKAHWTRIIHIAEDLNTNETLARPRLEPVYNSCLDIKKVRASSAEMYYLGAFPGFSLEALPGEDVDILSNLSSLKDESENWLMGLQRVFAAEGISLKDHAPQVVDPTQQIIIQIDSICIVIKCPRRIFTGSERGELASSQDERAWASRMQFRRLRYLTPRVIVPFVDRLIWLGVLPTPKSYRATWPELEWLGELQKAERVRILTEALVKYVQGGVDSLIAPIDFLVRFIGLSNAEAEEIVEAAKEFQEEETDDEDLEFEPGEEDDKIETEPT
jgi:hypothetical protein